MGALTLVAQTGLSIFGSIFQIGHKDDQLTAAEEQFLPNMFNPVIHEINPNAPQVTRYFYGADASKNAADYQIDLARTEYWKNSPMTKKRAMELKAWGDQQISTFCAEASKIGYPCGRKPYGQGVATVAPPLWEKLKQALDNIINRPETIVNKVQESAQQAAGVLGNLGAPTDLKTLLTVGAFGLAAFVVFRR